jgi:transcription elongation GreA/GreB family factor
MNKAPLRDELVALLKGELDAAERAHAQTIAGATHEEAKPENDKDTRATEASYLARGQARRVEELKSGIADAMGMPIRALGPDSPIGMGALVNVEDDDGVRLLFVAPYGGGLRLGANKVQVVTTKSPLGRALLGKREGDDTEVEVAGVTRAMSIVSVT